MDVTIFRSVDDAPKALGLVVVIDVFRAFTTEAYIFSNGAMYIIPVQTLEEAYELKKNNPEYLLVGERGGVKPEGFDYGNSPTELLDISFDNKIVVHTTSNGTKGLLLATQADEIITGSFVNAGAILRYIRKINPTHVSLVSTSHVYLENNEDIIFATYIRDTLEGVDIDQDYIKKMLQETSTYSLLFDEIGVPQTDFDLCLDFNRCNFIIKQIIQDDRKILVKVDI